MQINLKIDSKSVKADINETILDVATREKIKIPTLCYNEKISKTTSCFVCLVKDIKTNKFLPSCSAKVTDGMEIDASSNEVFQMRQMALNLLLSEHSGDCEAPCTLGCPAHANVEEYIRAIKNEKLLEGLKIIKQKIPMPLSVSRVCPRFCEKECRRNIFEAPVAINDFKRVAADRCFENYIEKPKEDVSKKVAIVGGGPGGLSAAYFLCLEGIKVDVFDKMPKFGGMLRYGIPEYRLPKSILDKEIIHFEALEIGMFANKELGKNLDYEELKKEYDAVIISTGCWKESSARIEGEESAISGISFLKNLSLNDYKGDNPGKTIVVGGGNTAIDCLRSSVRLGSNNVICIYRRSELEMPAEKIEILEAKEEGVKFNFLTAPVKLKVENGKKILTLIKMKLGEVDASGRRRPIPIENSDFEIECDTIITAIGQKTDTIEQIKTNRWGNLDVDDKSNILKDNVFGVGDCVTGPLTVVEAMASARKTVYFVLDYLKVIKLDENYKINVSRGKWQDLKKEDLIFLNNPKNQERTLQKLIPIDQRKTTFNEVTSTFDLEEISQEGKRCIECSCTDKADCKLKENAKDYKCDPKKITGEKINFGYDNRHPIIIRDKNKCIKCNQCIKICSEIVNENLLAFNSRGFFTHVETAFEKVLPESCTSCGKCLDKCPTGALGYKKKD